MISIQQLSHEVGIGTDTLRIWERRYGFPQPVRDSRGHRRYPLEQVEELRVVTRLQGLGYRPNKIFALTPAQRHALLADQLPDGSGEISWITELAQDWLPAQIESFLQDSLSRLELDDFLAQIALPIIQALDHSWSAGEISIAREHLVSDRLEELLLKQLAAGSSEAAGPRLLLVTPNGERHKLGLLMAACLFQQQGLDCLLIKEDLPISEIPDLSRQLLAAGVALSFSAHYPVKQAKFDLARLRELLPKEVRLIAGGAAVRSGVQLPGLIICKELQQIAEICRREFPLRKVS